MYLDQTPRVTLGQLPDTEPERTSTTLQHMVSFARAYMKPGSHTWTEAHALVQGLAQKDYAGELRAVFSFVRDHIRYVRDTHALESVQTPDATLDIGQGDCDDKATLLAALAGALGFPTRFVAMGRRPNTYSHVITQARLFNQWVSMDATEPVPLGWAPKGLQAIAIANVE